MSNTQTIKQKFLDILFEDDDAEPVRKPKAKVNENKYKASELLYGKKEEKPVVKQEVKQEVKEEPKETVKATSSAFINYENKVNEEVMRQETNPVYDESYVAQPALSPIFGNVEKEHKKEADATSVNYASVDKPGSSYLGTVLSPIYGYESNPNVETVDTKAIDEKEEILDDDITSQLNDVFATGDYKQEEFEDEKTTEIDLFSDLYDEDK